MNPTPKSAAVRVMPSGAPAATHAAAMPSIARARSPNPMTKSRIASSVGMTRRAHSRAASFSSNLRI